MNSPNADQLPGLVSALDRLSEDELVHLNHVIVERLRLMQQVKAHGQMMQLHIGQRVLFASSMGKPIHGVVSRHNRKSVTIIADDGHQWRVSPGFVKPE